MKKQMIWLRKTLSMFANGVCVTGSFNACYILLALVRIYKFKLKNMLENQIKIGKKLFTVKGDYVNWLKKYKQNKTISVGSDVNCVVCNKEMMKKKESYVFCGLQCKDDFWNKIDPRKRNSKRVSAVNRRRNEWLGGSGSTNFNEDWCTQGDDMEACGYHNKD